MPPKKTTRVKRRRGVCIFFFGAKKMKGLNKRIIGNALLKAHLEVGGDLDYVVMGNVRETEKFAYALCRKHHLPIAVVPSDFEKFSISAEGLRNGVLLKFFQPAKIVLAYPTEESLEEDGPTRPIIRWAKTHKVVPVVVGPKRKKKEEENARQQKVR